MATDYMDLLWHKGLKEAYKKAINFEERLVILYKE